MIVGKKNDKAGKLTLIMHVLQSMPVHIISACNPPKTVVKEIDRIMAGCFWRNNTSKHHWIRWKDCCKVKEDGGLGIKRLGDIIKVQSFKLYWKILTGESLWAKFMRQTYHNELMDRNRKLSNASTVWKRIREIRERADEFVRVNSGNHEWTLSSNGDFQTKSTWEHIRYKDPKDNYQYIWSKHIPRKISIFLWKAVHGKLVVDTNLQRVGIQLASKCQCCEDIETGNHTLVRNNIAKQVWNFYMSKLGMRNRELTITGLLKIWWRNTKIGSKHSIIFHVLPAYIIWELWKARCSSVHGETKMETANIIRRVQDHIHLIIKFRSEYKLNDAVLRVLTDIQNGF